MKKSNKIISVLIVIALLAGCCSMFASAAVKTPYPDSRFYTQGDYEIHYRVINHTGNFKGRILMLHGFLCSTYAWRNMALHLSAKGYDCVLADLPNFGYSTRENENTGIIAREELITGLMKSIADDDNWIIAGHSMGGGVAVNIAEEYPVKAVLLYCPAPQSTCPEGLEGLMTNKLMIGAMNLFFKIGLKNDLIVRYVIYKATDNLAFALSYDLKGVTAPFDYDGIPEGMCRMLLNVRETNLADASKITCPVLLVNAEKDIIITDDMRQQFFDAFPDAEKYTIMQAGHQCIEDRSEELCKVTTDFLSK